MIANGSDEPIFSGGSVKQSGEIGCGSFHRIEATGKRNPVFPAPNDSRGIHDMRRHSPDRRTDNHPYLIHGGEFKPDDRFRLQRDPGGVKSDRSSTVLSLPDNFSVFKPVWFPEITGINAASENIFLFLTVGIGNCNLSDRFLPRRRPCQPIQEKESPSGKIRDRNPCGLTEIGTRLSPHGNARLAVIGDGIDNPERNTGQFMQAGFHHGKIIVCSLVRPAAFTVFRDFIGKSHVHCTSQINRLRLIRPVAHDNIQIGMFFPAVTKNNADQHSGTGNDHNLP